MELEDARRVIAALNALSVKLEGDGSDIGLIRMLEEGSSKINEAAKTYEASTTDIASQIIRLGLADKIIKLLEADLKKAIQRMGDESSASSIHYLVESSVQQLRLESEKVAKVAAERTWRNIASKQVEQVKTYLASVQSCIDQASRKRHLSTIRMESLKSRNALLKQDVEAMRIKLGQQKKQLRYVFWCSGGLVAALLLLLLLSLS